MIADLNNGIATRACALGRSPRGMGWTCALLFACISIPIHGPAQQASNRTSDLENGSPTKPAELGPHEPAALAYEKRHIRGRFVWAADLLKQKFAISTVPEARRNIPAIWTDDGVLVPLVEDLRARAFRTDPRLQEMDLELVVRQYQAHPFVQVLRVYQRIGEHLYEVDYWCDVCSIVMFEKGPCACCQQENRLRRRLVDQKTMETTDEELNLSPNNHQQ